MTGDAPEHGAGTDGAADWRRAGRVLAARWSVERLRRPNGPELVWLAYAKPEVVTFDCLACGAAGWKQGALRVEGRTFYLCPLCASHQAHPLPAAAPVPTGFLRRYWLEYAADPAAAASAVAGSLTLRRRGRMLDLGCGLGLTVALAAAASGWQAAGIDPGGLAMLGAEALDVRVARGGVEALAGLEAGARFDVVRGEGVLGRSPAPLELLQAAGRLAAADALWVIAGDDAASLYDGDDPEAIRAMMGGDRLLILSGSGLRQLLARAGLRDLAVRAAGGRLRAGAAVATAPDAAAGLLDAYLAQRMGSLPEDGSARLNLLVCALGRAVARADWGAGSALAAQLTPAVSAAAEAARNAHAHDSIETLLQGAPLCAPALLYQVGLLHLGATGPGTQALLCFELCADLARRAHALAPLLMPDEAKRQWAAAFQAGLVRQQMGEVEAARLALGALATRPEAAARPWAERARAALAAPMIAPAPAPKRRARTRA